MTSKILITPTYMKPGDAVDATLRAAGLDTVFDPSFKARSEDEMIALLDGVAGILAFGNDPLTERVLAASKDLRIVARNGVGVDKVDLGAATRQGIAVCNAPGANADAVAEFTFALLLSCSRHMPQTLAEISRGGWAKYPGVDLAASTLGIVGLGSIAREVIKRAHAFRMRIVVYARRPDPELAEKYGVTYVTLEEVLRESDFLSLHLSLNNETRHLINYERLATMKPTACVINTARGEIIDTAGLRRALEEKLIAGAALDVHEQEPLTSNPFAGFDNVLVSPHAGAATVTARDNGGTIAVNNLVRFFSREHPPHIVNEEVLDRLK